MSDAEIFEKVFYACDCYDTDFTGSGGGDYRDQTSDASERSCKGTQADNPKAY